MSAKPARRSFIGPWRLGAVLLLALIGGGIFLVSSALDPNRLSDALQDAVFRATGREMKVAGGTHLRLGLTPQVELDDVSLANLPGASRPQMLTARSVTLELALLPLLGGEAVISTLSLAAPDLALERAPDGTANWQFSPARRALFQRPQNAGSGGAGGHHAVQLRHVHFDGGRISWRGAAGPDISLALAALDWSADAPDSPMALSAAGTAGQLPFTLAARAGSLRRLQGGPVSALAGTWPLSVDIAAADATLHVEGGINHPDQARGYQFRVTANAPQLDRLAGLLPSQALPDLRELNFTFVVADDGEGQPRSSQVSLHAGASDLGRLVPGLSLKQAVLNAPGPGQLAQLGIEGTYQSTPLRLALAAMQPDVAAARGPLAVTLSGEAAGATASAHGTIPPGWDATGLDLTVNLHAPDLAALSPLVGHALPAVHDVTLSGQLQDAGAKLRGVAARNLVVNASAGDLAGEITVQWAPRAAINGSLTSRALNLDALLPPAGVTPPARDAGQTAASASPTPPQNGAEASPPGGGSGLPLARMRSTDANLTLAVGDLTAGGQTIQDVQAHLELADGKLALNPLRARAPEGTIIGAVSIDASSDKPPVALTLRSPAISAAGLAAMLGVPGQASGTMQVDAQLNGVGQTMADITATLDGRVGLAMVNGQVDDSLVESLIGAALQSEGLPAFSAGVSEVRCFAARADFAAGVATLRALAADTSKLSLDGTGQIDLRGQTVDLHLRPRLRLGVTQVAAPVWLHGPFGGMKAKLDPVLDGGRVGLSIGGAGSGGSACASQLALARGGLGGPLPAATAAAAPPLKLAKPKDLLKGLFH